MRRLALLILGCTLWPAVGFGQNGQVVEYTHTDALGSVRVVTAVVGGQRQEVSRHDYLPFGEEVAPQTPPVDTRLFTGKERDPETGWDYFGARYACSSTGRFTSPDPLTFQATMLRDPQRFNLYALTRDNPLRWVDPSGEELNLAGDIPWLSQNVLWEMAGGKQAFDEYFYISGNTVYYFNIIDPAELPSGARLVYDLAVSSDRYLFYAGTSGKDVASFVQGAFDKKGRLTSEGDYIVDVFEKKRGHWGATYGRPNDSQPADGLYALVALNPRAVQTQEDAGGQTILPVSYFIHESSELLAFRAIGSLDVPAYFRAHANAIEREAVIRRDLHIGGGFAGGKVSSTVR